MIVSLMPNSIRTVSKWSTPWWLSAACVLASVSLFSNSNGTSLPSSPLSTCTYKMANMRNSTQNTTATRSFRQWRMSMSVSGTVQMHPDWSSANSENVQHYKQFSLLDLKCCSSKDVQGTANCVRTMYE